MNAMTEIAAEENARFLRWRKIQKAHRAISVKDGKLMSEIVSDVCETLDVKKKEIMAPTKGSLKSSNARQVAMWMCCEEGVKQADVARFFGRDHQTVYHACRKVKAAL